MRGIALCIVIVFVTSIYVLKAAEPQQQQGFFSVIKRQQLIAVKESGNKYVLSCATGVTNARVLEVGNDYLVIEYPSKVITRIHVTSILCINDMGMK